MNVRSALPLFLLVAACSAPAPTPTAAAPSPAARPQLAAQPGFDAPRIAAMKKALLAEPKVGDVMYQAGPARVAWTVAVHDDGTSRRGYAQYVCTLLAEQKLVGAHTDVRVVDIARVQSGDFRAASLGHVDCATSEDLGA
ncbi:hypothetical protein QH494_06055 [Sphingomonas sp. AR_OL41]|uniref:hypothetical protein n=1 Tax=Sphingomonas sp. AR_OL41 TaxID=3042729 RepID=UPI0024814298|nr:hypothetical protein [Sphingomonas sp. AR_OL41]MDH7971741.1 hypothetical protein [Sphingomonas sp. AR_OL41]